MRLIALAALLLLLAACSQRQSEAADAQLARQQSFLSDLVDENARLRAENAQLREVVLQNDKAIAAQNDTMRIFIERLRNGTERAALRPYARIPIEDVRVYEHGVVINVSGAVPIILADTHSMEPFADSYSKIIAIDPRDESDIHIGDIAGYVCRGCNGTVILHRVVATGKDAQGTFFILKGDNNPEADPERVRFAQIETVVVGVIY